MKPPAVIDYEQHLQQAFKGVVLSVLREVEAHGLPAEHHFFIAFDTQAPGVKLSLALRQKYPHEMVIVLRHMFENLKVDDKGFSVDLFFGGMRECLKIPLPALKRFDDPHAGFALSFEDKEEIEREDEGFSAFSNMSEEDLNEIEEALTALGEEVPELQDRLQDLSADAHDRKSDLNPANKDTKRTKGESAQILSFDRFKKSDN